MTKHLGNILSITGFGVLFVLCLAFVSIRVLGYGTYIVTGGSMEPTIGKGALVLVEPTTSSQVKLGDVITFQHYGQTTTHRVIAITPTLAGPVFKTKGDANTVADPEDKTFAGEVGIVRATVPLVGYALFGIQAYWRLALALVAVLVFFGCAAVLVFNNTRGVVAAPARPATRLAPATVKIDAEDTWNAHLAWLSRSRLRRQRVA